MLRITVPILLCACDLPDPARGATCEERVYAHPAQEETDSGAVYIGCEPPDGWVLTQPTPETGETGEAGASS